MKTNYGLLESLLLELCQTERSARSHCRREASRMKGAPAEAMLAAAEHAQSSLPALRQLARARGRAPGLGEAIGQSFSEIRHKVGDLFVSAELSYRGTLLGMYHGVTAFDLARGAARFECDYEMADFCKAWLSERRAILACCERALDWFAVHPVEARERVVTRMLSQWRRARVRASLRARPWMDEAFILQP